MSDMDQQTENGEIIFYHWKIDKKDDKKRKSSPIVQKMQYFFEKQQKG